VTETSHSPRVAERWRRAFDRSPSEPYTGAEDLPAPPITDDPDAPAFSPTTAAEIVGVTERQLDYWARTDLVRPRGRRTAGDPLYTYQDLLELKAIKTLLDAGIRLESVREVFRYLREHLGEDITSVNLVISGRGSVLVRSGEEIVDLLRQGQGVLNILPLAGVQDEVQAKIVQMFPTAFRKQHPA
jgi:DNA-binding transcriptional MerR regulator